MRLRVTIQRVSCTVHVYFDIDLKLLTLVVYISQYSRLGLSVSHHSQV